MLSFLTGAGAQNQILYFYCHATTAGLAAAGGPDASSLILTNGKLTLGELYLDAPVEAQLANRPLVFLNACESAEMSPRFYDGLVPYFMAKGARGVLGAECKVPALFAAEWAVIFFDSLLDGHALGECVTAARRHFLREHRNPLGLIYALHCDGDTRVAPRLSRTIGPRPRLSTA